MNYNGKEIEVTCTSQNDTIEITIFGNDLKMPFTFNDINRAAVFLAAVYGGTKEEAVLALKNLSLKNLLQEQGMERVVKNTSFNNEKGREDRCIEISIKDFFNMSMEEFDTYVRNEFLKKGIDINDRSLSPEEVRERYKDEIKALEEADAKLQEEENKIKNNIDRLVNHFKQEYKNKYNKEYNPTDREIEQLRIVVVDRYNYTIEQWEGIISTFINSYDENWKSDKSPEPRMGDDNYALVREWVTKRAYDIYEQEVRLKEKDRY
jgi:hypothetical protein